MCEESGTIRRRDDDGERGADLPLWAYKWARRMLTLKEPGVYALALIVGGDGRRELVVSGTKKEVLGR